ncbi:unnamed protein product, partial [Rotaria sp. Silwood2]
ENLVSNEKKSFSTQKSKVNTLRQFYMIKTEEIENIFLLIMLT